MSVETILVALTDADPRLTAEAVDLAAQTDARLVLGATYDEETHRATGSELQIDSPDELARRDDGIDPVRASVENAGIEYTVRGALGHDGEGFVRLADETDADVVIVAEGKRTPAGKAVFGSVPQHVLLNAPCPVLLVHADGEAQ